MNIAGLLKTATIDFPRRLAAVVFTAGCNYDCGFCHNRGLLDAADFKDNGEVLRFLEKRAGLLDGVVISGGEPTLQKDLAGFAATLKELGYDVKLDTNGSNPQMVGRLLDGGLVDYVAMDYKAPFARYPEVCGAGADGFLETLGLLWDSGIEWELRTTVIPEISEAELREMAEAVSPLPLYALQLYRPVRIEKLRVYTPQDVARMAEGLKGIQPNTLARC